MTREEHLKHCTLCLNRKFDPNLGIVCNLTDKIADFEDECENFSRDESVKEKTEIEVEEQTTTEIVSGLSSEVIEKLRYHQDLSYALIGGFFLSLICAVVWAVITVTTEYQIGYMAIAVGLAVGFGVKYFGAGIDQIYGIIGGFYAFAGCLLGNLFSQVGFYAQMQGLDYFTVLTLLDLESIRYIFAETFSPMDLVFYGIAIFEGYKFAFRTIPADINDLQDPVPPYAKLRLPLVVVCFAILSTISYKLSQGASGEQSFFYDSGNLMSTGEFKDGLEHGEWMYYYEDGIPQVIANYKNGRENGSWRWFDENGNLTKKGEYKNGLPDGAWVHYFENGNKLDSGIYITGRQNGYFESFHENGQMAVKGNFVRDKSDGTWTTFYENGKISSEGNFDKGDFSGVWKFWYENGKPSREIEYLDSENFNILAAWNSENKQIVANGNGSFEEYYNDNSVMNQGKVKDGKRVGSWKAYYPNGKPKEEGSYDGNDFIFENYWSAEGEQLIENGNGEYISYFEGSNKVSEKGNVQNGLKVGSWETYHNNSIVILNENNYENGKLNGRQVTYFQNGNIAVEGNVTNEKKEGSWKWYFESGNLQCAVDYIKDKKQGSQVFFSEGGYEAKEEVYEDGELVSETLL